VIFWSRCRTQTNHCPWQSDFLCIGR
jgi:hypothetical protein